MNGLHIMPRWKPAIPPERRSFSAFFQPIFPQLAMFHWIYPDTIPFIVEADFLQLIESDCSEGYIPPDTLLPKFANFVRNNDWADLFGFQKHPDVSIVRLQLHQNPTGYEWMNKNVDLCFFNVDGAFWEIYARDETLLATVRRHVTSLPDITVKERVLIRRDIELRPRILSSLLPRFLRPHDKP